MIQHQGTICDEKVFYIDWISVLADELVLDPEFPTGVTCTTGGQERLQGVQTPTVNCGYNEARFLCCVHCAIVATEQNVISRGVPTNDMRLEWIRGD